MSRKYTRSALAVILAAGLVSILALVVAAQGGPPELVNTSPASNAVSVPLDSNVVLTYSAPIDATSVTSRTVAVHSMMHGLVTVATHSTNGQVVTVDPNRQFFPGELVYTTATTQTTDITGTHPISSTVWQFNAKVAAGWGDLPLGMEIIGEAQYDFEVAAWGDCDGDGDLDLAVGTVGQNLLYLNDGNGAFSTPISFGPPADHTWSLAWGDFDGDGDLDLAVGNYAQRNAVYIRTTGTVPLAPRSTLVQVTLRYQGGGLGRFQWGWGSGPGCGQPARSQFRLSQ